MSAYRALLNLITRPAVLPSPPYTPPPDDMTLETAMAKHELVMRLLHAFPGDNDFQAYLRDFTLYQLNVVRRRVEAKLNDLQPELPLQYEEMQRETEQLLSNGR